MDDKWVRVTSVNTATLGSQEAPFNEIIVLKFVIVVVLRVSNINLMKHTQTEW